MNEPQHFDGMLALCYSTNMDVDTFTIYHEVFINCENR